MIFKKIHMGSVFLNVWCVDFGKLFIHIGNVGSPAYMHILLFTSSKARNSTVPENILSAIRNSTLVEYQNEPIPIFNIPCLNDKTNVQMTPGTILRNHSATLRVLLYFWHAYFPLDTLSDPK